MNPVKPDDASVSAMIDTLYNSIQSLTFGKKWIQFNAWFNIDGNNMKNNCGDSIQWIIQFNSYETGWIRMVPKKCPTNKNGAFKLRIKDRVSLYNSFSNSIRGHRAWLACCPETGIYINLEKYYLSI